MFTHTATIGRNVGTAPMSDIEWGAFKLGVLYAMHSASHVASGLTELSAREGEGSWGGVSEDSASITALSPERMPAYRLAELKGTLAHLCRQYGQDAIALSVNVEGELITFDRHSGI